MDQQPPCQTCEPPVHPFNKDVLELFNSCSDQVIVGPSGAIGLNDLAITNAMRCYFKVDKKSRLKLSIKVRYLFSKIQSYKEDQNG